MTSLERVCAAVRFQKPDRTPVIPQIFGHTAKLSGVPLIDYVRNGEALAECQLRALRRYGQDAVFAVMDANVEAEAAGALISYRADAYPVIEACLEHDRAFGRAFPLPNPDVSGRMPQVLKALRIMRGQVRDEVLVVGLVLGPFTLASQLVGIEKALFTAADEPEVLVAMLDTAVDIAISYGRAQLAAGAHLVLVFDPAASPAVVPPTFFREMEVPRLRKIFDSLASVGSAANWLHIAGPVRSILQYYPAAGAQIANFDYEVPAVDARGGLPSTCLDGNVRSLAFVDSIPAEIETAARTLCAEFKDRGGFILSSGCEIPPESSPDNVAALIAAARSSERT